MICPGLVLLVLSAPPGQPQQPYTAITHPSDFRRAAHLEVTPDGGRALGVVCVSGCSSGGGASSSVSVTGYVATVIDGGSVTVSNFPASQAVTGTFWPATQPVSGVVSAYVGFDGGWVSVPRHWVDVAFDGGSVSVANWPATQPVSIASMPSTPVTGTFWQATQPISGTVTANAGTGTLAVSLASVPTHAVTGPLTDTELRASAFAIKGAGSAGASAPGVVTIQGVVGGVTVPVSGPLTDTQLRANAVPVSGTFWQATQPVSLSVAPLTTVQGTVTANAGTGTLTVTHAALGATGSSVPASGVYVGTNPFADAAAPAAVSAGQLTGLRSDLQGRLLVSTGNPNRIRCRLTTTATGSTAVTGCGAPGAGLSIYVTDIQITGGVATGATAAASLQYGTGGTCGSGTTVVFDCQHPATSGCTANLTTPIKLPANNELCILDATTGTKFVSVFGYVAP